MDVDRVAIPDAELAHVGLQHGRLTRLSPTRACTCALLRWVGEDDSCSLCQEEDQDQHAPLSPAPTAMARLQAA